MWLITLATRFTPPMHSSRSATLLVAPLPMVLLVPGENIAMHGICPVEESRLA